MKRNLPLKCATLFMALTSATVPADRYPFENPRLGLSLREYLEIAVKNDDSPFVESALLARAHSYEAMPILCEEIAKHMETGWQLPVENIVARFITIDGNNLASPGDAEALRLTREHLSRDEVYLMPFRYIALKGNKDDIALLESAKARVRNPHGDDYAHSFAQREIDILKARVDGTNIVREVPNIYTEERIVPSVANTGFQALYVREILYRYWEGVEWDTAQMPPELLTMVVSFDGDGNPVSSVDLSKYGLTMPTISLNLKDSAGLDNLPDHNPICQSNIYTVAFPDLAGPATIIVHYMDRKIPDWREYNRNFHMELHFPPQTTPAE